MTGYLSNRLAGRLGVSVRVRGLEKQSQADDGWLVFVVAFFLENELVPPSVPAPLPEAMPECRSSILACCMGVCVRVRVVQSSCASESRAESLH